MRLDPRSLPAWSQLATCYISDYKNRWNEAGKEEVGAGQGLVRRARDALARADEIDPNIAQCRYAEGFIRCVEGRHQEGYEAMDRATSDPNFAAAHAQKANQLVRLGRAREALPVARHAVELAGPYDQSTGVVYWVLGRAYFVLKDYDDAIHWLQRSVDKRGNLWFSGAFLVAAYALPGAIKRPAKRCVNSTVGIRLVHAAADCQDLRHRTSQQPSTAPRRIVPWPKTRRRRTLS